jgi:hypothetical protein
MFPADHSAEAVTCKVNDPVSFKVPEIAPEELEIIKPAGAPLIE